MEDSVNEACVEVHKLGANGQISCNGGMVYCQEIQDDVCFVGINPFNAKPLLVPTGKLLIRTMFEGYCLGNEGQIGSWVCGDAINLPYCIKYKLKVWIASLLSTRNDGDV